MTRSEFAAAMALLSSAVLREMTKDQAAAWYLLLKDLTVDELRAGIAGALQAHTYAGFPAIGQIRQCARPELRALACDVDTAALAAWSGVVDAMRSLGGYSSVDFGPLVNATVWSLGGWVRLTDQTSEDLLRYIRPQFLQTFKALAAAGVRESEAAPLPGLADIDNSRKGLQVQSAKSIDLRLPGPAASVLPALAGPQRSRRLTERSAGDADGEAMPGTMARELAAIGGGT